MRSRAQLMELFLAHREAARAAENELKNRAAELFEQEGSADTWRLPGGQVITGQTHGAVGIVDREAFLDWLETNYPHEVRTRTVTVREVINDRWLDEQLFASFCPVQPLTDDDQPRFLRPGETADLMADGGIVPGVRWREGGTLSGVSIRPDSALQRRLRDAMAPYIDGAGPMPGLPAGESNA